jgi:hypothetical protein
MRAGRLPLALALALAGRAAAQAPADVPAGPAELRGQVVHAERPDAAAGVEVVLYALSPHAPPGLRRATSDAEGRFAFAAISNDPATSYLVGARFAGVPHPGARIRFELGETRREITVPIWDVSADPASIRVREVRARADRLGSHFLVTETVTLENTGRRTYHVGEAERAGARPAFAARLPRGASRFAVPLGIRPEGLVLEGERLAFFGALYPGPQELAYSYLVPTEDGTADLARRFEGRVERLVWLLPEGAEVRGSTLASGGEREVETRRYRELELAPVRAGREVSLTLAAAGAAPAAGGLRLAETRVFLDLDDAALSVREEYEIAVEGGLPVVGSPESPLLHIPLPAGVYDLRFHPDYGLQAAEAGPGIDVLGPVPSGESVLELAYRLPRAPGPLELERGASVASSLFTVFVSDAGLRVESERLHRRRPIRTKDQSYLHLEAFEVEPGEAVRLRLEPLPPRRGAGAFAWVFVLAAGAGALLFLSGPLRRAPDAALEAAPEESAARRERESLVAAIRDLDHDYETGKVAEGDYRSFRDELRVRALALLRAERGARGRAPGAAAAARCAGCGAAPRAGDRFCARCGRPLAAREPEGHEARG